MLKGWRRLYRKKPVQPNLGFRAKDGGIGLAKIATMAAPTTILLALFLFLAGLELKKSGTSPCGSAVSKNDSVRKDHFCVINTEGSREKPSENCIFPIREIKQDSILWQRFS